MPSAYSDKADPNRLKRVIVIDMPIVNRPRSALCIGLVALAIQAGCQTPRATDTVASPVTHTALSHAPPVTRLQIFPIKTGQGQIGRRIGSQARQITDYRIEPLGTNQWRWTLQGVRVVQLRIADDGGIHLLSEEEIAEAVIVEYDPPLVLVPARLTMNRPLERKTYMKVKNRTDQSLRDEGWCTYKIELVGQWSVTTPTGTFNAFVLQTERQIDLRLAEVQVRAISSYAPGIGQVAEEIHRVTRPMRLFDVKQSEQLDWIH